jgi:hypothetical protein
MDMLKAHAFAWEKNAMYRPSQNSIVCLSTERDYQE